MLEEFTITQFQFFTNPQSRFWELLIGAALAYMMLEKSRFSSWLNSSAWSYTTRNFLSFCGAVLLTLAYFLLTKNKRFPGWWALLPTLGAALMIAAGSRAWLNRLRAVKSLLSMDWFDQFSALLMALAPVVFCSHHAKRNAITRDSSCGATSIVCIGLVDICFDRKTHSTWQTRRHYL